MGQTENHIIKPACESDKDEILALYDIQKGKEYCPWTDEYPTIYEIDSDLERDSLFIMKNEEGKIISAISIDEDESVDALDLWSKDLNPGGDIARLAVLPEYQGQKIAARMIEYIMQVLKDRGYKSIHFMVNKNNVKAIKAYQSLKFNIVGEIYIYEQDMICYERQL